MSPVTELTFTLHLQSYIVTRLGGYATTCTQQCSDQGEEIVQRCQISFSLCDIARHGLNN